jgi:hypothetical protein
MKDKDIALQSDFIQRKIDGLKVYHNHKEIMVNAGFLVQLTLFTTIIMEDVWPPQWIEGDSILSSFSTSIIFTIFWLIIHMFIVWQLQNKIVASLYINGYDNALRRLIFESIEDQELTLNKEVMNKNQKSYFYKVLYHIFPGEYQCQKYDVNTVGLPLYISSEIEKSFLKGTAAKTHERLLVVSSILIWLLTIVRIF